MKKETSSISKIVKIIKNVGENPVYGLSLKSFLMALILAF